MSAATIEAGRIAGALKCLDALRQLEQSVEKLCHGATAHYAQRLTDVRALVTALGPMTPEQEGAVAVLAERILRDVECMWPETEEWIPLSTMTDDERHAMIESIEAENAAEDVAWDAACDARLASKRVVISMEEWRSTP